MAKRYGLWIAIALMVMAGLLAGCSGEKQTASPGESTVPVITPQQTITPAQETRTTSPATPAVPDITSQQAFELIQQNQGNPDFIILDVRTAAEFKDGHIPGAVNIDVNLPSFRSDVDKLKKDDTYLVYCRTGNRSQTALRIMKELGFTSMYHLVKGITEWTGAGYPVNR